MANTFPENKFENRNLEPSSRRNTHVNLRQEPDDSRRSHQVENEFGRKQIYFARHLCPEMKTL